MLPHLHYVLGTGWRFATSPWRHFTVPLEDVRSIFGVPFGIDGGHHLVETIKEYEENPVLNWKESSIYQFHTRFQPNSISELVACNYKFPLFEYPWGGFTIKQKAADPWRTRFCGPSSEEFIFDEFERTIALYRAVRATGYRPWKKGNGFVSGTLMRSKTGETRFVVMQGNHRLAALSALGVSKLVIRLEPGLCLPYVNEANVGEWPHVAANHCSKEEALNIFSFLFNGENSPKKTNDWQVPRLRI